MSNKAQAWLQDNAWQILDSVVDAVLTINTEGIIQTVNRATTNMFGYEESELVNQPLNILMPEPFSSAHQGFVQQYLDGGPANIIGIGRELLAQKKDGLVFPIYLAINELGDRHSRFFAGIIRDLTEYKNSQEKLFKQQQHLAHAGRLSTMGELTASIAHEINQPLTAIAMYAQASLKLLEREEFEKDKLKGALDKLISQSLRAGAVIERIQRFVRNESGQKEVVNLTRLLQDLQLLAVGDARLHGIRLEFHSAPDLPEVFCDPIQIQQVALNLIRNSIDAMNEIGCENGDLISIETRLTSEHQIEVSVEDSGTGVSKEQRALIFSAFHTTKVEGMGMGLSICRSIIEEHGGQLDFRDNKNFGVTFYFQLPLGETNE